MMDNSKRERQSGIVSDKQVTERGYCDGAFLAACIQEHQKGLYVLTAPSGQVEAESFIAKKHELSEFECVLETGQLFR